jgi:hypothetical protein
MPAAIVWTDELEQTILMRIAHGESVRAIAQDPELPASSTIYEHLIESTAFAEKYARAREAQMEAMADEILAIADDSTSDTMTVKRGDSEASAPDNEWINRSRLRVDTRKWLMSKLAPKKYGDKQEITGKDGAPLGVTIVSAIPRPERE